MVGVCVGLRHEIGAALAPHTMASAWPSFARPDLCSLLLAAGAVPKVFQTIQATELGRRSKRGHAEERRAASTRPG